jgi:deazaflavin-dependent oxidoreductase (nitroreductase family)
MLRKTPVMKIRHRGGYLVVASYGGAPTNPTWFHNLRANPRVEVQDRATVKPMLAREVTAGRREELWPVADAAWPHFSEYRARTEREIPMFELREETPMKDRTKRRRRSAAGRPAATSTGR